MTESAQPALPTVSVVVAARPEDAAPEAARAAQKLDYPRGLLEIIVARGRQPSVQRNAAVRAARGELIYFLDDDSIARPDALERAAREFADPAVVMVGGPNLCPPEAPPLEQSFALAMGSPLAFFSSSTRYRSAGRIRATTEKELILCNLVVRRQAFLDLGGFDEALYPNEENALMDNLLQRGFKLIYDPEMIVCRRPRRSLGAFARMLRNYGRGRAEQFRRHPTARSAPNFVPPLFLVYLAATPWLPPLFLAPLALYLFAVLLQTAWLARAKPGAVWRLPPLLVLCHLMYGAGFWRGLFTRLGPRPGQSPPSVALERVTLSGVGAE